MNDEAGGTGGRYLLRTQCLRFQNRNGKREQTSIGVTSLGAVKGWVKRGLGGQKKRGSILANSQSVSMISREDASGRRAKLIEYGLIKRGGRGGGATG